MRRAVSVAAILLTAATLVAACGGDSSESTPQVAQGGTIEDAADAWGEAVRPFALDLYDAFGEQAAVSAEMTGTWGTDRMPTAEIQRLRERFQGLLDEARALPGGTPEIEKVNAALVSALALIVRAHDQYLMGIKAGRFELMERGDDSFLQAQAEFLNARPELDKVVGEPQGEFAEEIREVSDEVRAASLSANQGLRADSDMVDALERGDWKAAARAAAKAKSHFRTTIARLEALAVPTDEHLRTFLNQTIVGYRLLLDAQTDYARGTASRDIAALKAGDKKAERGFQTVAEASERLAEAAKSQTE